MALFDAGPTRRVLCLHGGGSRAEILRMQLRPFFASAIGKGLALDFECIDGMYECVGDPMLEALYPGKFYSYVNKTTSAKSSYASKDLYPHPPAPDRGSYVRLPASVAAFRDLYLADEAPRYEGIVGFSQGANLAAMLLADFAKRGVDPPVRWAVLMGGGDFGWASALRDRGELFAAPIASPPVLATIGTNDERVGPSFDGFRALFGEATLELATHDEDHRPFPADHADAVRLARRICDFVDRVTMPAEYPDIARLTTPQLAIPPNVFRPDDAAADEAGGVALLN
jgi:hypothetical protein